MKQLNTIEQTMMTNEKISVIRQWLTEEFDTSWVEFKSLTETLLDDYTLLNTAWIINDSTKVIIMHNYPANISVTQIIQYKGAHAFTCQYDDKIGKLEILLDRIEIEARMN